jgi:hypothetical protein
VLNVGFGACNFSMVSRSCRERSRVHPAGVDQLAAHVITERKHPNCHRSLARLRSRVMPLSIQREKVSRRRFARTVRFTGAMAP